jgi:CRP-like cAMP-binding protein
MMRPLLLLPNEHIVRKGDPGEEMFFIQQGVVEVVSEDGRVVFASMRDGEFFGEISLVFSCPRTASIRTATHCDMFVLSKTDLDQVLKSFPEIREQVRSEAEERFALVRKRSEKKLAAPSMHSLCTAKSASVHSLKQAPPSLKRALSVERPISARRYIARKLVV